MFRCFLTGHADLLVDNFLPFISRHSPLARYTRLVISFLISGLIHYHADQLMGVLDAENGAIVFFLLHAAIIFVEDTVRPVLMNSRVLSKLPRRFRQASGCLWVLAVFIWSSPVYIYASSRLGVDTAALLPVRIVGPWIERALLA